MNGPLLGGYSVFVDVPRPKMTLAGDVMVTPEFREEINAWMKDFFGVTYLVEPGQTIVMRSNRTITMHPKDASKLTKSTMDKCVSVGCDVGYGVRQSFASYWSPP